MALFHGDGSELYVMQGPSRSVRLLLQAAGVLKSTPETEDGWKRLVRGMVRESKMDGTLTSDGEGGILAPGVERCSVPTARDMLGLRMKEVNGLIDIKADKSARGQVQLVICDQDNDWLFAKLLATALFFMPAEPFRVSHVSKAGWRNVLPEVLLSRHLLEASERRQPATHDD